MMRSLWSAVSGLTTHQLEMDVIGNNISNVNTTSYKSQATGFKDVLYQTVRNGAAGADNRGSTNIAQVGLGVKMGSIYTNIAKQGSAVITDSALDLMINGDSFFVVEKDGVNNFTRDGSFTIDKEGYLVTQNDGYYVKGVDNGMVTNAAPNRLQVIKRGGVDNVDSMPGQATSEGYITGNIDSDDPVLDEGKVLSIEVYGTTGDTYTLKFRLTNTEDISKFDLALEKILDAEGNIVTTDTKESITLEYDKHNGKLISDETHSFTFDGDAAGKIAPLSVDFSNTTNYAGSNGHSSTIYAYKGNTEGLNKGYPEGVLTGISFGTDGTIYGKYSNGQSLLKGQMAVSVFSNAMGLEKVGNNLYSASLNSGEPRYQDITVDGGYMNSGVLEGSNIDLAKEFTDMITTQRGFQANSRVITTSDEMLQIVKGLKR